MRGALLEPVLTPVEDDTNLTELLHGPASAVLPVSIEAADLDEPDAVEEALEESFVEWANDELKRAGLFDKDSDYEGMLGRSIMKLVRSFAGQGHSGFSAQLASEIFGKLSRYEPLTPLTSDPDEWNRIPDEMIAGTSDEETGLWQSRRDPRAFSRDGGETWTIQEAAVEIAAQLEEAFKVKWDESKHPRWPKGTPRAGEFMKVGQRFSQKGTEYEISHIVGGKVYANVATGKYADAKTVAFKPKKAKGGGAGVELPDIAQAEPKPLTGGKGQGSNVPVVDPYVDKASHDPSLKMPEGSSVTADQWKRFGQLDQEHYIDLMERFGKYSPSASQALHDAAYADYEHGVQSLVKGAFSEQFGSSSGFSLSLTGLFKSASSPQAIAKAHAQRERAKELQGDLAAVVQWDLYNRTHSPDLATFHKSSDGAQYWDQFISGNQKIFSGLSQSFHYRQSFFGHTALATPVAIRHILMSSYSAQPIPGQSNFASELEVSVPEQLKLDKRSLAFDTHGSHGLQQAYLKWLEGVTSKPRGGEILEQLQDAMAGKGELDIPPAAPVIKLVGAGTKQWLDPLPEAAAQFAANEVSLPEVQGNPYDPTELKQYDLDFEFTDDAGNPVATVAQESGYTPGDYMLGLKGTLYWVGADPGDDSGFGLRYHKIVNGEFTGESYNFEGGGKNKYFKVKGHHDPPKPPKQEGFKPYAPGAWANSPKEKFIHEMKAGDKFKVAGNAYELIENGAKAKAEVQIKSLDTGKLHTVNTDLKTPWLVPKDPGALDQMPVDTADEPYLPKLGEVVMIGDAKWLGIVMEEPTSAITDVQVELPTGQKAYVDTSQMSPFALPYQTKPEKGDIFPVGGVKHTVTNVMKNGTVSAKPPGGNVAKFAPDDPHLKQVFRPAEYKSGSKVKAGEMGPGALFSASPAKVRPYMVLGAVGSKVHWLNLETGQRGSSTKNKSWNLLALAPDPTEQATPETPKTTPAKVTPHVEAADLQPTGEEVLWKDLPEGAYFEFSGHKHQKLSHETTYDFELGKELGSGADTAAEVETHPLNKHKFVVLEPGGKPQATSSDFDLTAYSQGAPKAVGEMGEGDVFLSVKGIPLVLKKKGAKATAQNVATGGMYKNIPLDKEFVPLAPKAQDAPTPYSGLTPGDETTLATLKVGDQFKTTGGGVATTWQVIAEAPDAESNPVVAEVGVGGALGQPSDIGAYPDHVVWLHAKAENTISTPVVTTESSDLLVPETFVAYQHAKSGTAKHHKVSAIADGHLIKDKSGQTWKIKSSGPTPVITDGENNYTVPGDSFVKLATPQGMTEDEYEGAGVFTDVSPPLGDETDWDVKAIHESLVYNTTSPKFLSQAGLEPGDFFVADDGYAYKVNQTGLENEYLSATALKDGKGKLFAPDHTAIKLPQKAQLDIEVEGSAPADNVKAINDTKRFVQQAFKQGAAVNVDYVDPEIDWTDDIAITGADDEGFSYYKHIDPGKMEYTTTYAQAAGGTAFAGMNLSWASAPDEPGQGGETGGPSYKLNTEKVELGSLPLGTEFSTKDGKLWKTHKQVKGGWIISKPLDGGKAKPFHPSQAPFAYAPSDEPEPPALSPPEDGVPKKIAQLAPGDEYWVDDQGPFRVTANDGVNLHVELVPGGKQDGGDPKFELGVENYSMVLVAPKHADTKPPEPPDQSPAPTFADLKPGDWAAFGPGGTHYKIITIDGDLVTVESNVGKGSAGTYGSDLPAYDVQKGTEPFFEPDDPTAEFAPKAEAVNVAGSTGPLESPVVAYQWPKSGSYKHTRLGDLQPGTVFGDKVKAKYEVVSQQGHQTLIKDETGEVYGADSKDWVRAMHPPPGGDDAAVEFGTVKEQYPDLTKLPLANFDGFPSSYQSPANIGKYPTAAALKHDDYFVDPWGNTTWRFVALVTPGDLGGMAIISDGFGWFQIPAGTIVKRAQ